MNGINQYDFKNVSTCLADKGDCHPARCAITASRLRSCSGGTERNPEEGKEPEVSTTQ